MNSEVDDYLDRINIWKEELTILRKILLDTSLTEEYKWRQPCYTFENKNILILGNFKAWCSIGFFKGALLKDEKTLLKKQGENTQSARILTFTSVQEILEKEAVIREFVQKAIEVEKAGLKIDLKKPEDLKIPQELQEKMQSENEFRLAFESLTPGRQKAYILYINSAKQPKTRISRIEKYSERILNGKGINDCVCGLSSRLPACDGSHSKLKNKISAA